MNLPEEQFTACAIACQVNRLRPRPSAACAIACQDT